MKGIYKSSTQPGVYFVIDTLWGIYIHASGTLEECRAYCRERGWPIDVKGSW